MLAALAEVAVLRVGAQLPHIQFVSVGDGDQEKARDEEGGGGERREVTVPVCQNPVEILRERKA